MRKETTKEKQEETEHLLAVNKLLDRISLMEALTPMPHDPLFRLTQGDNAMDQKQLDEWVEQRNASVGSIKLDKSMSDFEERCKKSENELFSKGLDKSADWRHEDIPTRSDTQVVVQKSNFRMPMSTLLDYYGNRIVIGQAPKCDQMAEFWAMVFQEKVRDF